jgi:dienelactone hydrolase
MAEVVLFHHVQGLTPGLQSFADELRGAGHTVHTPDLFGGRAFETLEEGMAYAQSEHSPSLDELADAAVAKLPDQLVYAGISFGVMAAQRLAQTRPGARGAVLVESCVPITGDWAFGPWPTGVPVQVHGAADDPFFAGEGDIDAARELVSLVDDGELFVYPGDKHLFEDSSLATYDAEAAALLTQRVLDFLAKVDAGQR